MRAHETLERAGRHGGFPARGSASGLLAACPSDGSHDFYLSMMLDVPVPRVPMLRARLQDSRRGAQRASDAQEAGRVVQVQREHGQTPPVMAGSERADPSRRPAPGRAFQRVAPARRVGSVPGEPSGARPRLLRLERHRLDPRWTAFHGKQGEGKPRLTCGPWLWRRGHGKTPAHG